MEDEELREKIEQLRANRGSRRPEYQPPAAEERPRRQRGADRDGNPYQGYPYEEDEPRERREDGILGVFTFQSILAVTIAILYVLLLTLSPELSGAALSEVKERAANDFSFRGQVYETVGNLLTYLNELQPVEAGLSQPDAPSGGRTDTPPEDGGAVSSEGGAVSGEAAASDAEPLPGEEVLDGKGGEFTPTDGLTLPPNATYAPLIFTGRITFPLEGAWRVTSGFGFREHPTTRDGEFHTAVDLAAAQGTNILAAADGVVTVSEESGALGRHIVIDHGNGFETVYGHCDRLIAREGARVREGEVIAKVGSTGDSTGFHLHFGMRKNGLYFDPVNVFPQAACQGDDD